MIPENAGTGFPPFAKPGTLKKGTIATIQSEFSPPQNAKISSFLIANVEIEGETLTLGINPSTYRNIAKDLTEDTTNWIGKEIKFLGMTTLGKGKGYLWVANKSEEDEPTA